ncbi:anaerobic sulfatase maturase [Vibrio gazogenes]|uniref:Anaerobic sulfatase maturase n=1 Tax=Vibrio gazogenes TaxID=687 RepID=A0A1Z2SDS2_VIBGA|nr:anaerobic sulfatase maturase [Vibrio gazogenes]ASA55333.1 anaerobic sulfatase maturase [Vibrio gazogenes]
MQTVNQCHVMSKPSSSKCNLDCSYCFYLEKEKLYPDQSQWQMTEETLELYVRQYIQAQSGADVQFVWQGGEPTLMGIDFFRKVIAFCDKYGEGKHITHAFQTNGVLLNDEWCEFFIKHDFLIGLSIDGPQHLHDKYRLNRAQRGSFDKVIAAVALLQKHRVDFTTLTVVSDANADYALDVYQFLKQIGSTYMQFIPLVEREIEEKTADGLSFVSPDVTEARVTSWSVTPLQYGQFLTSIFDEWVKKDVGKIFVQTFDNAISSWCGEPAGICIFAETCGHAFALESNGDLYNCDHFVYPEHKLGNIHDVSIFEMNNSEQAIEFGQSKKKSLTPDCQHCEFLFACNGGCPKHRFNVSPSGFPQHNYFCAGYKHYFRHIAETMGQIRGLIFNGQPVNDIMILKNIDFNQSHLPKSTKTVSRNSLCPCGSGKKYKKCCMNR